MTRIPEHLLHAFEPRRAWLSHDSYFHGIDHLTRVFILQELICTKLEEQGVKIDRTALRYAAIAHDVGRVNDDRDPDHGRHSATWMNEHLAQKMTPEELDTSTYAVHWHALPDKEAPVMTAELSILKDADNLDRVRLGNFNPDYLRNSVSRSLISTAEELWRLSQSEDEDRSATYEEVVRAASTLGLIADRAS